MSRRRKQGRPRGSVYWHGRSWWLKYSVKGERVRVNTGLRDPNDESKAEDELKRRLAESDLHRGPVLPGARFENLAELVRAHYVNRGNRSLERTEFSLRRLGERFAKARAEDITAARLDAYVADRLKTGVSRGTVRVELAALRLGFRLAVRRKLIGAGDVPALPELAAGAPRTGFFEADDFRRVLERLPDYLRPVARFAYATGWRKGEILGLQWKAVDLAACVVRLEGESSKNGEARTLAYGRHPELVTLLREQDEARRALVRRGKLSAWVFHHDGEPIRDMFHAWREACRAAGVPRRLFHDLRRTAVRNFERAGVSRSVAMKVTGHRTESVYRRYAIVSEADVAEGLGKAAAVHLGHISAPNGDSGTLAGSGDDSQAAER